jgi:transcriptional regulator PpsR
MNLKAPRKALDGLAAETVAGLVTAAADIVLVLDRRGIIRDMAFGSEELASDLAGDWIGQPMGDVVSVDSQPKIALLLGEVDSPVPPPRHANHPLPGGGSVAISWSLRRLDGSNQMLALGRDLRVLAGMQQRLIEAEQSLERDYSRLRMAEARYRLLLQSSAEPIVVVDLSTQKVVEANPMAARLLGEESRRIVGRPFAEQLDAVSGRALPEWFAALRAAGRAEPLRVRLAHERRECRLPALTFRQENSSHALLRLESVGAPTATQRRSSGQAEGHADGLADGLGRAGASGRSRITEMFDRLPDALVVTDADGRILALNRAFIDIAQLATDEQALGESLERWFGRSGVDLGVLLANLRESGEVRSFATRLRGELGGSAEVEISATRLGAQDEPAFGFALRRRRTAEGRSPRALTRSVEQLTELVGRVSLKELVRETTDVIERLCIEAALELTRDNRASAAEMLGLSRQSLYVKLRRYGLGDLEGGEVGGEDPP